MRNRTNRSRVRQYRGGSRQCYQRLVLIQRNLAVTVPESTSFAAHKLGVAGIVVFSLNEKIKV